MLSEKLSISRPNPIIYSNTLPFFKLHFSLLILKTALAGRHKFFLMKQNIYSALVATLVLGIFIGFIYLIQKLPAEHILKGMLVLAFGFLWYSVYNAFKLHFKK